MKTCHIYPVPASEGAFQWKWRSTDGKHKSSRSFELFYDCVEDARGHGAEIDLDHAHNAIAEEKLNLKFVAAAKPANGGRHDSA